MASTSKKTTVKSENKVKAFFTGIITETKRIRFPKFSELVESTGKVLFFCLLFALFFVVCDFLVSELLVLIGVGK